MTVVVILSCSAPTIRGAPETNADMSTPASTLPVAAASPGGAPFAWPNWAREPLLHFVVLGAVLFGVDHALVTRTDDPHVIVMGAEVDAEARRTFEAARGRQPTPGELAALRQVWLDNEVLYREGMAMQVDKGDTAIRERVIFKALSVVDANTRLPEHGDAVLERWFAEHRAKYDEPARFDFEEAALDGQATEAAVRAFVAELEAGAPGDAKAGLRVFKARPRPNIVQSYGAEFAAALESASPGHWQAMKTRDGWRAIRLDALAAPVPADFKALQATVLQDWTDAVLAEQRSAAVRVLAKKYVLKTDGAK
jgi:hypothetical protein